MTEKWGQIHGKWDLVRVSGGVLVTAVLLYFHNNKFNTETTQHQIALQRLKCRAWVSYLNIDIRIVGKNIVVHRCIGVSLQPF